jgi:Uncharacterized protein conserved in bacteria (DUF2333)
MESGQFFRKWWRNIRARFAAARAHAQGTRERIASAGADAMGHRHIGVLARAAIVAVAALLILYPGVAWFSSAIDDNPGFAAAPAFVKPHMSHAVANAGALIHRETRDWTPNAPWFSPRALLTDMPNYQKGVVDALGRFALALNDESKRTQADSDLETASRLLQYPPDVWIWNPSNSIWPAATSESQYRRAAKALGRYNAQLASGQTAFDASPRALAGLLDRMGDDLAASSALIETHIRNGSGSAAGLFYSAKGEMYADYILLKGLQSDFAGAIRQHDLDKQWAAMMATLRVGSGMRPVIVMNGSPDGSFIACTLCGEGFYLLRARNELRELTDILQQ